MRLYLIIFSLLMSSDLWATPMPNGYKKVAREYGIPSKVFFSIALQESGKKWNDGRFLPWPWTLNVRGKAKRYESKRAACTALRFHTQKGHSTDIGLMQIHWNSHYNRFPPKTDPCILLQPELNLRVAAVIYKEQYKRSKKNTWKAVGWYHHPSNESLATKYRTLVKKHYRRLT